MRRSVLERSVKRRVTSHLLELQRIGAPLYFTMPVPSGYGRSGLDYEGCLCGLYFAVEAKSPDEDADLTPRQRNIAKSIVEAGGKVFIISDSDGMVAFRLWIRHVLTSQLTNSSYSPSLVLENLEKHFHAN